MSHNDSSHSLGYGIFVIVWFTLIVLTGLTVVIAGFTREQNSGHTDIGYHQIGWKQADTDLLMGCINTAKEGEKKTLFFDGPYAGLTRTRIHGRPPHR